MAKSPLARHEPVSPRRRDAVIYLNRDTACFVLKRHQARLEGLPGILRVDKKQTCCPLETDQDVRNIVTAVRIVTHLVHATCHRSKHLPRRAGNTVLQQTT